MKKRYNKLLVIAPLLATNVALAGDYTFTTGAEYTSGNYGSTIDTTMLQIPFTLGYSAEQFAWSVTVPYVRISGSEDVTFSGTTRSPMLSGKTSSNVTRTDSGLGDITLSGTYQVLAETNTRPWFAMTGKIKLGTADENKQLGTGENDYAIQLELAKNALHGYLGYKIIGDNDTYNFNNVMYGAAGITIPAGRSWTTITEFYTEQAAFSGADDIQELSLTLSKRLKNKNKLSLYIFKGLTNSGPDWGGGVAMSYPL